LIQTWRELSAKKVRLLNMYGQTETVGNILIYDIPDQLDTTPAVIPLGPPIAGTQVYLLDENNQAPLQGEIGQIHVGGDILARGYINQPRLTAGQFIPDPFSDIPGSRLFKTGDQGSLLPDNTICFKGRTDFQVSIRGFRIEPGEAEAALKLHPGITGAVVSVFENASGNKELIAYFETEPERPVPGVDEIRQFLAGKIPEYMIPSRYMRLDSLPRLPNGKINRHDLPQPLLNKNRPELSSTYIVPGNPAERAIAEIWQEILNLEKVGIKDNFFDLGGNSLLAAQVIDRLSRLFTLEFPISMLFERPTVQSFSQIILQKDSEPVQGQDSVNRGKMRKAMQKRRMKG
ncbi:MAG: non-ribosomal peptide synthetase, partial [Proteobacteria bacterium]|nr:non-ribosomal peptide synthetase [Pseudomonadota bacterium]